MKIFRTAIALLLLVAVLCFADLAQASGTTLEHPATRADSVTTGTLSVGTSDFQTYDLATVLRISASDVPNVVLAIRLSSDGTSTETAVRVKSFAASPSSANLDGSTAARTGLVVHEGETLYVTGLDRYLAVHGDTGTAKVRIARVR